jgi:hypothetical protein
MSQLGFEPTILVFELSKTVHALDRAATDRPQHRTAAKNAKGDW